MMRISVLICFLLAACTAQKKISEDPVSSSFREEVTENLRKQILEEAAWAMQQEPVTVTAQTSTKKCGR